MSTREGPQFLIGGVGCLVGAVLLARHVLGTARRARESATWPSAPGVVRKATKVRYSRNKAAPRIEYTYDVGSTTYRSKRIGLVSIAGTGEAWVDRILEAYPEGKRVEVFYDPKDPSYGVLRRGPLDARDHRFLWFLVVALASGGVANLWVTADAVFRRLAES